MGAILGELINQISVVIVMLVLITAAVILGHLTRDFVDKKKKEKAQR